MTDEGRVHEHGCRPRGGDVVAPARNRLGAERDEPPRSRPSSV